MDQFDIICMLCWIITQGEVPVQQHRCLEKAFPRELNSIEALYVLVVGVVEKRRGRPLGPWCCPSMAVRSVVYVKVERFNTSVHRVLFRGR